jgi:hypothetical protein
MKKMVILTLIVLLMSCKYKPNTSDGIPARELSKYTPYHVLFPGYVERAVQIRVVNIDGCEYLVCWSPGHAASIIHKANCQNPVHKKENE